MRRNDGVVLVVSLAVIVAALVLLALAVLRETL
jgi:Tfp pilus assembly protein PilX